MPRTLPAPLISFLAMLLALSSCSTGTTSAPQTGRYVVTVPKASFYKYGPAQSFGPDLQLPKGQKITQLEHGYGFSHVMTDDGTTGYVANEDIKPAPSDPLAAVSPSQDPFPSKPKSGKPSRGNSTDPLLKTPGFDVNDVPLPSADSTPAPSGPRFRY